VVKWGVCWKSAIFPASLIRGTTDVADRFQHHPHAVKEHQLPQATNRDHHIRPGAATRAAPRAGERLAEGSLADRAADRQQGGREVGAHADITLKPGAGASSDHSRHDGNVVEVDGEHVGPKGFGQGNFEGFWSGFGRNV
jgi:hypothetical protein